MQIRCLNLKTVPNQIKGTGGDEFEVVLADW